MATNNREAIHQHTIPVCYLANFGVHGNQGRNSSVFFFDKVSGKKDSSGVESFPIEKRFYALNGCDEYKQIIEKFFSTIEGELATLLRELFSAVIEDSNERSVQQVLISTEQRNKIAAQIAMIYVIFSEEKLSLKTIFVTMQESILFIPLRRKSKENLGEYHHLCTMGSI